MIPRERKSRLQCPRNSRQDNMERFSLSELGLSTENKAIQGILCPMGVELCHLLLALEREDGICTAFPTLGEKAGKLAKAMEELAAVARRLSEDSGEEGRMEMCPMGESLLQAGRDVVLAAFQLQEHPDSPWHREHLAAAAKRTLMETAKILQLEEAAGMRRITGAASWLLECLSVLRDARDTPGLLAAFQAFSEAVLLLSHLTAKRLQELGDCPGGKSLAQTLQLLHKCVSLIHTAKQDTLMYSRDSQADLSQDSVFHLTERTIRELLSLLMEPQDRSGIFSQQKHPGGGDHSASLCPRTPGLESAPLLPQQHQDGPSSISPAKQERGNCDKRQGGSSSVSQVTQDMATRMLHMAQFLRRKGPIASKEQFVAYARQMVADGQVVVKFGNILAKHCLDQRCSMELLHATEHTQSVSSQLGIVARVKAVTGESKASSELLLSNVQNLIQAVQHVLRAAEAACVKGLGQPPADPEEEEVAAFCQQWRKNLTQHRAKEALNSDRDELGLRKTRGAKAEPTLMSLGQEQPPRSKTIPKHPNPRKGHTVMERHL